MSKAINTTYGPNQKSGLVSKTVSTNKMDKYDYKVKKMEHQREMARLKNLRLEKTSKAENIKAVGFAAAQNITPVATTVTSGFAAQAYADKSRQNNQANTAVINKANELVNATDTGNKTTDEDKADGYTRI